MGNRTRKLQILAIGLVVFWCFVLLLYNLHEEKRSLFLQSFVKTADYIQGSVQIVKVNISTSEVTARMRFRLAGSIAKDEITPISDLKLFLNSSR